MPGRRPPGHIGAYLADYLQRRMGVHAIDPGQVHPGHPVQVAAYVKARRVPLDAVLPRLLSWWSAITSINTRLQLYCGAQDGAG